MLVLGTNKAPNGDIGNCNVECYTMLVSGQI